MITKQTARDFAGALHRHPAADRRTTPLTTTARRGLAQQLRPAGSNPRSGRHFSAGWGTNAEQEHRPVEPELDAEFVADTATDTGRYRSPVRFVRGRAELRPMQLDLFPDPSERPPT